MPLKYVSCFPAVQHLDDFNLSGLGWRTDTDTLVLRIHDTKQIVIANIIRVYSLVVYKIPGLLLFAISSL